MTYKIGQILTSKYETELETTISGKKVKVPAGNKVIIGADKLAHHLRNGMIQPLAKSARVSGYDTEGLAEYLTFWLKNSYHMDEFFKDNDIEERNLKEELESALEEIGFYGG